LSIIIKAIDFLLGAVWKVIYAQEVFTCFRKREQSTMTKQTKRGVFICVEGLDGSGKTTQAKILVRNLRRRGVEAVYTTEPSAGKVGKLIRRFVLNRQKRVPVALEALLFAADRVDHVEAVVKSLLEQGKVVVCDRYVYSTLAYQGAAGLSLEWIECVNRFALGPHLALFIDVPSDVVVKRLKRKKTVMETKRNQEKVREIYLKLVQEKRLRRIDGDRPVREVANNILGVVLEILRPEH